MELAFGGRRVTVTAKDLIIGSDPSAELVVQGLGVLPRHACARMRADGVVEVKSLAAGGSLLHNGARVGSTPQVLVAGDRLAVGDQEVVALGPEAAAGAVQRLNVTMMGMPAVNSSSYRAPPTETESREGSPVRVALFVVGGVIVALLAYFFLFQG